MFGPHPRTATWEQQQANRLEATGYLSRRDAEIPQPMAQKCESNRMQGETSDRSGVEKIRFSTSRQQRGTCTELGSYLGERDTARWQQTQGQSGCYVWAENQHYDGIANWPGRCSRDTTVSRRTYPSAIRQVRRSTDRVRLPPQQGQKVSRTPSTSRGAVQHAQSCGLLQLSTDPINDSTSHCRQCF